MSNAVSARIERLNMPLLRTQETHGRREDQSALRRKVRDVPSLSWSSDPAADALALVDRYEDHVRGAFIPKGGTTKVLHMMVKLPDTVAVGTEAEAREAMMLAVDFADDALGGRAVFAARIDRDERTTRSVDLFIAPVYQKGPRLARGGKEPTKGATKTAVSMTHHLKLLVKKHGRTDDGESARSSMIAQGQALQDALVAFLASRSITAERGKPKAARGSDWRTPEELGAAHDREAAEQARQEAQDALRAAEERSKHLDDRERRVLDAEVPLLRRRIDLDARQARLDDAEASVAGRKAAVGAAEAVLVADTAALAARSGVIDAQEQVVRAASADLDTAIDLQRARTDMLDGRERALGDREQAVRADSAALDTASDLQRGRTDALDARERVLEGRERSIGDRGAKIADAEREVAETEKRLEIEATQVLARATDLDQREQTLAGDRRRLDRDIAKHEAKRRELSGLANRLTALVEPVRRLVGEFLGSVGMKRQALEPRGRAAEAVLEDPAIVELAQIAQRLVDLGR